MSSLLKRPCYNKLLCKHTILGLNFAYLVAVNPSNDLIALVKDSLLVLGRDLVLQLVIFNGRLHSEGVSLESVLCLESFPLFVIFFLVLLRIPHHPLDFLFAQTTYKTTYYVTYGTCNTLVLLAKREQSVGSSRWNTGIDLSKILGETKILGGKGGNYW